MTPRARIDEVGSLQSAADGSAFLGARVRAVAEKGAANRALEKLVAGWLEVPASSVSVTSGARSRLKTVTVEGDGRALLARLNARLQAG